VKLAIGAPLLFIGLLATGFSLVECIYGDQQCFFEWWILTIPLSLIGHWLMRGYAKIQREAVNDLSESRQEGEPVSGKAIVKPILNPRVRKQLVLSCYLIVIGAVTVFLAAAVNNPNSLRPRIMVNEETVLRDLRTVMSAEAAYAFSNAGYYGGLECLARPAECIPSYPQDGPVFLAEPLDGVRSGFIREFLPGPPAGENAPSPSSIESYAFIAYPVSAETGVRSFCADSTGVLCFTLDRSEPLTVDGACAPRCLPYK